MLEETRPEITKRLRSGIPPVSDSTQYREGSYFESRFTYDEENNRIWSEIVRFLDAEYGIEGSVLDVGAGYGYFIDNVSADHRFAVDISSYPMQRISSGVHSLVGSATELPFEDDTLDVVMASNVLEHLIDPKDALAEFWRVLSSDGTLFVVTPNFALAPRAYFDDFTHETVFTHRSMADILTVSGFRERDRVVKFLPFSADSNLPVHPLLVRLYLHAPISPMAGQSLFVATPERA